MYLKHAKDHGKDVRVNTRLRARVAPCARGAEVDQVGLYESVPKEAVVCPMPQWHGVVMLRLSLKVVRNIDRVGEIHGTGLDERLEDQEETILIWVVDLSFTHGEDVGRDDLVDHMTPEAPNGLGLGNDNDILVYKTQCQKNTTELFRGATGARRGYSYQVAAG